MIRPRVSIGVLVVCFMALSTLAQIPSGIVSWWRAENNLLDSVGTNDGVAAGNLLFSRGYVGSGFSLSRGPGSDPGGVRVPNNPSLQPNSTNLAVAAWVRGGGFPGAYRYIVSKSRTSSAASWGLYTAPPVGTGVAAPAGN